MGNHFGRTGKPFPGWETARREPADSFPDGNEFPGSSFSYSRTGTRKTGAGNRFPIWERDGAEPTNDFPPGNLIFGGPKLKIQTGSDFPSETFRTNLAPIYPDSGNKIAEDFAAHRTCLLRRLPRDFQRFLTTFRARFVPTTYPHEKQSEKDGPTDIDAHGVAQFVRQTVIIHGVDVHVLPERQVGHGCRHRRPVQHPTSESSWPMFAFEIAIGRSNDKADAISRDNDRHDTDGDLLKRKLFSTGMRRLGHVGGGRNRSRGNNRLFDARTGAPYSILRSGET